MESHYRQWEEMAVQTLVTTLRFASPLLPPSIYRGHPTLTHRQGHPTLTHRPCKVLNKLSPLSLPKSQATEFNCLPSQNPCHSKSILLKI